MHARSSSFYCMSDFIPNVQLIHHKLANWNHLTTIHSSCLIAENNTCASSIVEDKEIIPSTLLRRLLPPVIDFNISWASTDDDINSAGKEPVWLFWKELLLYDLYFLYFKIFTNRRRTIWKSFHQFVCVVAQCTLSIVSFSFRYPSYKGNKLC